MRAIVAAQQIQPKTGKFRGVKKKTSAVQNR
jgi:hypothetical protein